jgi:hypothetical protein
MLSQGIAEIQNEIVYRNHETIVDMLLKTPTRLTLSNQKTNNFFGPHYPPTSIASVSGQ